MEDKSIVRNAMVQQSGGMANQYLMNIQNAIDGLQRDVNQRGMQFANLEAKKAGGFVAENFLAGKFNIDAALKESRLKAIVPETNGLGSADINLINRSKTVRQASAKFYSTGKASAHEQAQTLFERYKKSKFSGSFEDYLKKNNIPGMDTTQLYNNQIRLIPEDQIPEARDFLIKRIKRNRANGRHDLADSYEQALTNLDSSIRHGGVDSGGLTKKDSTKIANDSKTGNFDPSKYGLSKEQIIRKNQGKVLKKSMKTGLSAAAIAFALNIGPELFNFISEVMKDGNYNFNDLLAKSGDASQQGAEAFLLGSLTAYFTINSQAGIVGEFLKNTSEESLAGIVLVTFVTIKESIKLAKGEIASNEFAHNVTENIITVIGGVAGSLLLSGIPVVGTIIGSMLGSMVAGVVFNKANNLFLSFAISSDLTFFHIVDQNYVLPEKVLKEIGIEVFEYDKFEYERFEFDSFEIDRFVPCALDYEKIDITFLRRGVIGINRIGYTM